MNVNHLCLCIAGGSLAVLFAGASCGGATSSPSSGDASSATTGTGGSAGQGGRFCVPGSAKPCIGPGACPGAQVCLESGDRWGVCDCGPVDGGAGGSLGSGGGFVGVGGGGTGGAGGAAGASGSGTGGMDIGTGTGGTDAGVDAFCSSTRIDVTPLPTDVFIMQDKSGSMTCPAADDTCQTALPGMAPPTRWDEMSAAINTFVNSPIPTAAGVGVGLGFFGVGTGGILGSGNVSCNAADYATPVVPIAPLPGNAMAISTAIASNMPSGGTPTLPALDGAIAYAKSYSQAQMGKRTAAVLLVTDGIPTGCTGNTIPNAVTSAQAGFMGTPSIRTFVVGMGDTAALDQVALAGSGGTTHYIPTQGDVAGTLIAALTTITGATTCAYVIPTMSGAPIQPWRLNVQLTATGVAPTDVGKVDMAASCGNKGGWYYDDSAAPSTINLCPQTCDLVKANPATSVQVLVGCPSLPP